MSESLESDHVLEPLHEAEQADPTFLSHLLVIEFLKQQGEVVEAR
jgi:hypothetical protein